MEQNEGLPRWCSGNGWYSVPSDAMGDTRDTGLTPGWGRSSGGGNGNPLQYSCLKTSTGREPGRLQSTGLLRVGRDWVSTPVNTHTHTHSGEEKQRRLYLKIVSKQKWHRRPLGKERNSSGLTGLSGVPKIGLLPWTQNYPFKIKRFNCEMKKIKTI